MSVIHQLSFVVGGMALASNAHAQGGSDARATVQIRVSVAPRFALGTAKRPTVEPGSGQVTATMVPSGVPALRYSLLERPIPECPEQQCGAAGSVVRSPARYILIVPD